MRVESARTRIYYQNAINPSQTALMVICVFIKFVFKTVYVLQHLEQGVHLCTTNFLTFSKYILRSYLKYVTTYTLQAKNLKQWINPLYLNAAEILFIV